MNGNTADSFKMFSLLPAELRLVVWELSWPEGRVIEAVNAEFNTEAAEYTGITFLRLAGPLSIFLGTDFGAERSLDNIEPLEQCHSPIALEVCQESRRHTLSQYRVMEHAKSSIYSFFSNPSRDILWLCRELTCQPECRRDLRRCYGKQLDSITAVLVEESEWVYITPARYTSNYLTPLLGLETILVIYGLIDEFGNLVAQAAAPDYRIVAEQLRLEYGTRGRFTPKALQFVDRYGRLY